MPHDCIMQVDGGDSRDAQIEIPIFQVGESGVIAADGPDGVGSIHGREHPDTVNSAASSDVHPASRRRVNKPIGQKNADARTIVVTTAARDIPAQRSTYARTVSSGKSG